MRTLLLCFLAQVALVWWAAAQESQKEKPLKLTHAEPLYIDLIRDLGAHKGEREWNVGMGFVDRSTYDSYEFLVEYEWAVIDRLGLEIEVPVTFNYRSNRSIVDNGQSATTPSNRVESLKLATQYTFAVSERLQASFAAGLITELELADLDKFGRQGILQGMLYNPFFVAAKRWGESWHSLVYTGPRVTRHFGHSGLDWGYECNLSFHYLPAGSRNFAGLELNFLTGKEQTTLIARPELRVMFTEKLLLGFAPGIPVMAEDERLSFFCRFIYEPGRH